MKRHGTTDLRSAVEGFELHRKTVPMETLVPLLQLQMENGGRANLTVTGYSMMPMLRNRKDTVELAKAEGVQKKGDIILYKRDSGAYVLHRIISVKNGGYICCGDNQYEREPVSVDQVLAVVTGFARKGRSYTVKDCAYRLYAALWVGLFPLRKSYIAVRRRLGRWRRNWKKVN